MTQLFSRRDDARLRGAVLLGAALMLFAAGTALVYARSGTAWRVGEAAQQPIPFSHAIHAGQLDLDCRSCHSTVERRADAGMPTAETCLGCHERVWNVSAQFAPLRSALALGDPVIWSSVNRLPDHVRFHHGAHSAAGGRSAGGGRRLPAGGHPPHGRAGRGGRDGCDGRDGRDVRARCHRRRLSRGPAHRPGRAARRCAPAGSRRPRRSGSSRRRPRPSS